MSTLIDVLAELRSRGVRLWSDDGRLRFDAPAGAMDGALRAAVQARRAELIDLLGGAGGEATGSPVRRVESGDRAELSYGQRRMWLLAQMLPESGSAAYVLSGRIRLEGELDREALRRALQDVVHRHEALRTVFGLAGGEPRARVLAPQELELGERSVRPGEQVGELAAAEARRPFDLEWGPLLRACLLRERPGVAHLLLSVHHICADAWSLGILYRELGSLYGAYLSGTPAGLPELPVRYRDYAAWQRESLTAEALAGDLAYWGGKLAGAPVLTELPADRPRPAVQSYRGAVEPFALPAEDSERVRALAAGHGATPFMVLLAAWAVVLHRCGAGDDLPIATPVAGRLRAETDPLIGFFVNTVVLRVDAAGSPSFAELLGRVRQVTLEAFAHQRLPFEQLVDHLQPERSVSHSPVFQHMFILQNATRETFTLPGLACELIESHTGTAKFDTTLTTVEGPGGFHGTLEYATDLFDAATVRRLLGHWRTALASATRAPGTPIAALPLHTPAERERLLMEWNSTAVPRPGTTVHALVAAQAAATPGRTAIVQGELRLSYAQLQDAAGLLAARLRRHGARPGQLVGLCLPRTPDLVVAVLAILMSGAAYVPLDPGAPGPRNAGIIADAGLPLVLTTAALSDGLGLPAGTRVIRLDEPGEPGEPAAPAAPSREAGPGDLAYAIFTSGSTGRPKGVLVEHRNAVNFLLSMTELLGADGIGTWLAVTTVSFDISVLELLWTLTTGSTVVLQRDAPGTPAGAVTPVSLSLFYFASARTGERAYRLLLEGARYADTHGFEAVWTPERHFHPFGGAYPNPAVTGAALAVATERVAIRAGSVVLPLHDPLRVVEEWSVVDNLSGGRAGISVASGWQADDFVLAPGAYHDRKAVMIDGIRTLRELWAGRQVERSNGRGRQVSVGTLPRPLQAELPLWVTAAGSAETFRVAGQAGANVLTHLLGQDFAQLAEKLAVYRQARADAGHPGPGRVTLMIHAFCGSDPAAVRQIVRQPFRDYLASSLDLIANMAHGTGLRGDPADLPPADLEALLDRAFSRYYDTAGLFGTPQRCAGVLGQIAAAGVDEVACLIDFGIAEEEVLASLPLLAGAWEQHREGAGREVPGTAELIRRHQVTCLQCTPSQAAMLLLEPGGKTALGELDLLLVGGEELPAELARELTEVVRGRVQNMYGPTETTIWSTSHRVDPAGTTLIGRPIGNTFAYVLDQAGEPVPVGVPGELFIGGSGVARGYLGSPGRTARRFLPDPFRGGRMYRTGDLVRYRPGGDLEFIGRDDRQVKVRGYRIELGEIEAVLLRHPAVAQAAVVTVGSGAATSLAGYVTACAEGAPTPAELRGHLRAQLPGYMVPAHLQVLPALPVTPNGKIDRKALPVPGTGQAARASSLPPRDVAEMRVARLWEEALGLPSVGVHDDFFELGGNSVLAVSLLSLIERDFGRRLPLAVLFSGPTVAAMARALAAGDGAARRALVRLRQGDGVPLFLLPGAGGNLVYFHWLVSQLPGPCPVYGLQPVYGEDLPGAGIVEALADRYVDEVVKACPSGPYRLAGHSFGGYVALEVARRLRAAGAEITFLGLLDTAAPLPGRQKVSQERTQAAWLAALTRVFERIFQRGLGISEGDLAALADDQQVAFLRRALTERGLLPPEVDDVQFTGLVATFLADQRCLYVPGTRYAGELTLLRAAELHEDSRPPEPLAWVLGEADRGWGQFSDRPVQVIEAPGDHLTMLTPPHVTKLARILGEILSES